MARSCASLRPRPLHPENDLVNARWFPAKGNRAVIVLPHWNANGIAYNALGPILNRFGISMLRLSKPYHDIRRPQETARSDYAVSPNICRTLDARARPWWTFAPALTGFILRAKTMWSCGHQPGIVLFVSCRGA
jgi:hypothetical protein